MRKPGFAVQDGFARTACCVCRAIISSSSVGITQARTRLSDGRNPVAAAQDRSAPCEKGLQCPVVPERSSSGPRLFCSDPAGGIFRFEERFCEKAFDLTAVSRPENLAKTLKKSEFQAGGTCVENENKVSHDITSP